MNRRVRVLMATTALLALPLGPRVAAATTAWVGESSMLGGTARYDSGEWIYQDFVYDDYGADTIPVAASQRALQAPTAGDFRYPVDERYAANAADIVEVCARAVGDDLQLRVMLNALIEPTTTVLGYTLSLHDALPI